MCLSRKRLCFGIGRLVLSCSMSLVCRLMVTCLIVLLKWQLTCGIAVTCFLFLVLRVPCSPLTVAVSMRLMAIWLV